MVAMNRNMGLHRGLIVGFLLLACVHSGTGQNSSLADPNAANTTSADNSTTVDGNNSVTIEAEPPVNGGGKKTPQKHHVCIFFGMHHVDGGPISCAVPPAAG
jgi:hypothetical protein